MTDDAPARTSLRHRLYHGETTINFVGRKNTWFAVSGLVILAGLISLLAQALNYGIDFKGGTSWKCRRPACRWPPLGPRSAPSAWPPPPPRPLPPDCPLDW